MTVNSSQSTKLKIMTTIQTVEKRISDLEKVIKVVEKRLKNLPQGNLYIKKINKVVRYYCRNSSNLEYLGKNKTERIKDLEERDYFEEVLEKAQEEKTVLEKAKKKILSTEEWENIFIKIPQYKRNLIYPVQADSLAVSQEELNIFKNHRTRINYSEEYYLTQNGEKVRSKSELIIADRLRTDEVPYLYEPDVTLLIKELGKVTKWNPDFKVINLRTGKQYLWEHFGMMDNPEYFSSCQMKLKLYAENDFFVGENLIITMESSKTPISTEYIECLIRKYLK